MALFKLPDVAEALDALLDQEREMLLLGRLESLVQVGQEKLRLLKKLPAAGAGAGTLEKLREKADRNQELLAAVIRGIRSVSRRLEMLQRAQTELRTYDKGGQSQDLAKATRSFEHKA